MSGDSNSVAALLASITKNLNQSNNSAQSPAVNSNNNNNAPGSAPPVPVAASSASSLQPPPVPQQIRASEPPALPTASSSSSYPPPPPIPSYPPAPAPPAPTGYGSYGSAPRANPYDDRDRRDPYARQSVDRYADPYAARRDDRGPAGYGAPPGAGYEDPYSRRDPRRSRSRSPGRRAGSYGSYGAPPPVPSAGPGMDERTTDTMMIDQGYVGLIIGKRGETLRRIEQTSGCRVQFVPENQTRPGERACNLVGTRRQCEIARRMIDEVVDDNIALKGPLPGARHQARSGYQRMSQPPPSSYGAPPAHLGYNAAPAMPSYDRGPPQPGPAAPAAGEEQSQIQVPDKTVGLIIGRGGENVKDLQNKSHAKINIVPERESVNGMRPINLVGTPQAMEEAKRLIFQIVADDEAGIPISRRGPPEALGAGSRQETVRVPQDAVGMIIGKGGETVRDMQDASGCLIKVSTNQHSDMREITLTGTDATISRARQLINDKVDQAEGRSGRPPASGYGGAPATSANAYPTGGGAGNSYGAAGGAAGGQSATGATGAAADPYAAYGGYDNYVKAWQLYQSQQQQAGK
ncbi:hypothetical protein PYCC9005_003492 [Savitreella phatthalungensis]